MEIWTHLNLALSLINAAAWAFILVLSYRTISRDMKDLGPERRLRMITIVGLLAMLTILILWAAVGAFLNPSTISAERAVVWLAINVLLVLGGVVLIVTWPDVDKKP